MKLFKSRKRSKKIADGWRKSDELADGRLALSNQRDGFRLEIYSDESGYTGYSILINSEEADRIARAVAGRSDV